MNKILKELKFFLIFKNAKNIKLNTFKMFQIKNNYIIKEININGHSIMVTMLKLKDNKNLKIGKIKLKAEIECIKKRTP